MGQAAGLIGALLTALLPLHLRYAQIARPYTLLAALSLASAYFLVRALRTNRPAHWIGFALTATLNFYNHFNAIFVLVAEGLYAGIIWLATLVAVLRRRQRPPCWWGLYSAFWLWACCARRGCSGCCNCPGWGRRSARARAPK